MRSERWGRSCSSSPKRFHASTLPHIHPAPGRTTIGIHTYFFSASPETLLRSHAPTRRPVAFPLFLVTLCLSASQTSAIMSSLSLMSILDLSAINWFEAGDFGPVSDSVPAGLRKVGAKTIKEGHNR